MEPNLTTNKKDLYRYLLIIIAIVISFVFAKVIFQHFNNLKFTVVNRPFPDEVVKDLRKKDLTGELTIISFTSSWCKHCLQQNFAEDLTKYHKVPNLRKIAILWRDKTSSRQTYYNTIRPYFDKILVDDNGEMGFKLGIVGVPETLIIDHNGIIRYKVSGRIDTANLLAKLNSINDENNLNQID